MAPRPIGRQWNDRAPRFALQVGNGPFNEFDKASPCFTFREGRPPLRLDIHWSFEGSADERDFSLFEEGGYHMGKVKMPHEAHEEHLCYLHNLGYVQLNFDDYKTLVKGPQYVCKNCGRAAANEKNLCKPDKL